MSTNQTELTNLIQAEIRQNNHQMLEAMQKMLDSSVSQLKRSTSESAESQLQEIKKLKYNEPHKFKKRANEDQFKFNSKVIDTMNDAATALEKTTLERAVFHCLIDKVFASLIHKSFSYLK